MPVTPASIRDREPPPGAPPPGQFRVTIRIERPDGQFVTSERLIPDDLIAPGPDTSVMQDWAVGEVGSAFVSAYHRAAELAE